MKNNIVIEFVSVSKKFRKGQRLYLKQALLDIFKFQKSEDFWAVRNISFKINKGEIVGIIGANGSGKSTILKLMAKVLVPTRGKVNVVGKVGPLIELGAGFHPELSGRENIFLNGTILGLTKSQVDEKFDSIVEFAELEEFIDTPVKHYSSGMYMRLGFSIAIHVNPDILLVDEILAVGDVAFQQKCLDYLNKMINLGVTLVIVSHDTGMIRRVCRRVLVIDKGKILLEADAERAISFYHKVILDKDKSPQANKNGNLRWGDKKVIITKGWVEKMSRGIGKNEDRLKVRIKAKFLSDSNNPIFGIIIKSSSGNSIFESNTNWLGQKTGNFKRGDQKIITWEFDNCLNNGNYTISPAIAYEDGIRIYDWREKWIEFSVIKSDKSNGVLNLKHSIKIQ